MLCRNVADQLLNQYRLTDSGTSEETDLTALCICLLYTSSAVGYQPTLATEMGELQERIASTKNGSVTSVQAVYVPADDLTDPAPATTFAHLDADVYKRQLRYWATRIRQRRTSLCMNSFWRKRVV